MATEVAHLSTTPHLHDSPESSSGRGVTAINGSVYPDGIKTSGQHPPIYDQVRAFEEFPVHIEGPTVWKAEDYLNHREKWVHSFTPEELSELSTAADAFIASGERLIAISKTNFKLAQMYECLQSLRDDLLNGKGFVLFQGLPMESWGRYKAGVVFMGLSLYLGNLIGQNAQGLILGHVSDQGHDPTQLDKVKISRTSAPQLYHTDECDIVGLLCCAKAKEGGESGICSAHTVWNELREKEPDVLKTLTSPVWYVDRKGEMTEGQDPWIRTAIFLLEPVGKGRVYIKWDASFVKSLSRFSNKGLVPPLSAAQIKAMHVLEKTCVANSLQMQLEVGNIQFVSCDHLLHARTGFVDHEPPAPQRHLFRTWIATSSSEGGWNLPFPDSAHVKRGGIQVDDQPPVAEPLIAS